MLHKLQITVKYWQSAIKFIEYVKKLTKNTAKITTSTMNMETAVDKKVHLVAVYIFVITGHTSLHINLSR